MDDETAEEATPLRTSKRAAAVRAAAVIRRHNRHEGRDDDDHGGSSSEGDAADDEPEATPAKRPALRAGPARAEPAGADATLEHALADGDFDIADWFQFDPPRPPPPALQPPLRPAGPGMAESSAAAMAAVGVPVMMPWWSAGSAPDTLRAADAATGAVPALLHVKLPAANPLRLPPGLPAAFTAAFAGGSSLALSAAIRPGCVLLSVDALLAADGAAAGADVALERLLSTPGAAGEFFRSQPTMSVYAPGTSCQFAAVGMRGLAPAARLPPLAPLAAMCGAPVTVTRVESAAGGEVRSGPVHCRLHGRTLLLAARSRVPTGALAVLESCAEEGCALLEACPADASTAAERCGTDASRSGHEGGLEEGTINSERKEAPVFGCFSSGR